MFHWVASFRVSHQWFSILKTESTRMESFAPALTFQTVIPPGRMALSACQEPPETIQGNERVNDSSS